MKKPAILEARPKVEEKPTNPDRIDDKWRPPISVTEPGESPETYLTGKKLGKGGFAVCFEGTTKRKSELFALKIVKAKVEQKKMMEKFRTELQIHAKMQHPNIVEFYRAFTLEDQTYVVLEICRNGSLTDMVKVRSCLSLPEVRRFMIQICGGVKYMHKRSVIHRDLKMGNIFLDSQMNIKIGDFGLAAVMADEHDRRTTLCGTPNYIAPEILSKTGTRGHDNKVDTWAIGVICYAMLMGTPPFQSKTQQEIYAKLRSLEYEWKIDSKNYVPQQAKDFVAACLNLVSAERPEMDELVDHEFFKMGAIADVLDQTCLKGKPIWLENADPRGDKVRPGYGVSYSRICSECGVGKTSDGRARPAVGGKVNISTLVEIEIENRQDTAPTIPLPEGILYKQFTEVHAQWSALQKYPLQAAKPRSKKTVLEFTSTSEKHHTNGMPVQEMPPPPLPASTQATVGGRNAQSFAAQQRQQALPTRTIRRPMEIAKATVPVVGPETQDEEISTPQGLLRARPVRALSTRPPQESTADATRQPFKTLPKSTSMPGGLDAVSIDTLQARRPTTTSRHLLHHGTFSRATSRALGSEQNATTRPASSSSASSDDMPKHVLRPIIANDRQPPTRTENSGTTQATERLTSRTDSSGVHPARKPRLIGLDDPYSTLSYTSAAATDSSLHELEKVLSINQRQESVDTMLSRAARGSRKLLPHVRIEQWVDYSKKYGIAYILTNGTLGMVLKSSKDNVKPGCCVVVRNARAHAVRRARGTEHQYVPQGPDAADVEFYEQTDGSDGIKCLQVEAKEFEIDLDNHSTSSAAVDAMMKTIRGCATERLKDVSLLDKFGKYMTRTSSADGNGSEYRVSGSQTQFVHFYQKIGNVSMYRFIDGALQVNFPDHTKVVVHQDDAGQYLVDFVHLDSRDAKELGRQGIITREAIERRANLTLPLSDVLTATLRRTESEIVRTNEFVEKLSWIRAVVGCWIREGGVGWMGEEKLGWSGLQETREDRKAKVQWFTIGRFGGDAE